MQPQVVLKFHRVLPNDLVYLLAVPEESERWTKLDALGPLHHVVHLGDRHLDLWELMTMYNSVRGGSSERAGYCLDGAMHQTEPDTARLGESE